MKRTDASAPRLRGRPRGFDREAALERAMEVFWRQGYEGTSITDLTRAMRINPPSLYAAFGDKERLYLEALERYQQGRRDELGPLLDQAPTARQAIERLLHEAAMRAWPARRR
ncbi:MAG: TetR/AcrR family transcriptional regulator [Betaproteobacteria bacterium]|nr:MAG: TetR/AcrR family transcriptional regulator [Betaproteobacteria bacterium]